jgi:hypothetical protein
LGFHKGAFQGLSESGLDTVQKNVFIAAGFDRAFIERALSTPNKNIWTPSSETLIAAKVVTGITDGTSFAASGFGTDLTKEKVAASLAQADPLFRALQLRFPTQFGSMVDEYLESVLEGKTEVETIEVLRGRLIPFIMSLIPQADDDVLIDYNKVLIDQYTFLNAKNVSTCYSYASGTDPSANFSAELSRELLQREREVEERVVRTAAKRAPTDQGVLARLFAKLRKELLARGVTDADFRLLESTDLGRSQHSQYCRVTILFFREISRLPRQDSATVLRSIFASRT